MVDNITTIRDFRLLPQSNYCVGFLGYSHSIVFLVVNQSFEIPCQSHCQGVNERTVKDGCMRGYTYIAVDCLLIGSGENRKWSSQIGELSSPI
jgi:hypothetical protein